jgi:hypothetical protein
MENWWKNLFQQKVSVTSVLYVVNKTVSFYTTWTVQVASSSRKHIQQPVYTWALFAVNHANHTQASIVKCQRQNTAAICTPEDGLWKEQGILRHKKMDSNQNS